MIHDPGGAVSYHVRGNGGEVERTGGHILEDFPG